MLFTCTVQGHPVPQYRVKPGKRGMYTPKESRRYRSELILAYKLEWHGREPLTIPVAVTIKACFRRWPGDVDNYAKQVMDALQQARVIHNDRNIPELHVYRVKSVEEALTVMVEPAV